MTSGLKEAMRSTPLRTAETVGSGMHVGEDLALDPERIELVGDFLGDPQFEEAPVGDDEGPLLAFELA